MKITMKILEYRDQSWGGSKCHYRIEGGLLTSIGELSSIFEGFEDGLKLSTEQVQNLDNLLKRVGFSSWDDVYDDPMICDGTHYSLMVDGKSCTMFNKYGPGFEEVMEFLYSLMGMKWEEEEEDRPEDLNRFYDLLGSVIEKNGGTRMLSSSDGYLDWPVRGIYFFMEPGEDREGTPQAHRIVRVGTHALKAGSRSTLWKRLSQHKGTLKTGGGNHRGSIFRLIVGRSLISRFGYEYPTWGQGNTAKGDIRAGELSLERKVSEVVGDLPFTWVPIDDEPGPDSLRGYIERNSIALLSNYEKDPVDPPSSNWLGRHCDRQRVRRSGLWNSNHVNEDYDPDFLDAMEELIDQME
jgi:hypothetical protein